MASQSSIQQAADTAQRLRRTRGLATLQAIRDAADYHRVAPSEVARELSRRRSLAVLRPTTPPRPRPTAIGWKGAPE